MGDADRQVAHPGGALGHFGADGGRVGKAEPVDENSPRVSTRVCHPKPC